jgi:hypothetical protein
MGDWKLVSTVDQPSALFNLAQDIGETTDLAAKEPERVKQLTAAYAGWNSQMEKPRWQTKGNGGGQFLPFNKPRAKP